MSVKLKPMAQRTLIILLCVSSISLGLYFILKAFNENIVLYLTPTDLMEKQPSTASFRLGGLVKEGSVKLEKNTVEFILHDSKNEIRVSYNKVLPSLFKEGQGAVVDGKLSGKKFIATELLAKHDENYTPPKETLS